MSGTMSKRAAARNEKALQELVRSVPGNNLCADCAARNPAWASWSLGIFLCMRCAAIHRKLGTHVSKVKSLSMDSWSNEQVDNMRKVGNVASNKIYNPQNKKPPVPIDADEADSAMERFIRAKYMGNGLKKPKRNSTGSIVSEEGTPPPLPPKNTSKFGLRSASSFLSLSGRKKDKGSNPPSRDGATSPRPSTGSLSPRHNKPSKVFGAAVDYGGVGDDMEQKLRKLKDMGFTDEQRNLLVLNGMHGNMEKTVEALVRLGEGTPTEPKPRALTPTPITSTGGLSLNPASPLYDARPASASTNPFDNIKPAPAPPQSSQSTGTMPNSTNPFLQPGTQSTNPFGVPAQQGPDLITQAFSGMSLAPQQVLFPHHTGPMPPQQTMAQPYQQSMTPPVYPTANFAPMSFNSTQTYPPPSQPLQPQNTGYNPFLQNASPKANNPLAVQTAGVQNTFGNNPFTRSPTRMQPQSPLAQIPETIQQNIYYTPQPAPPQQSPSTNPFLQTPMSAPLQLPNPYQQQAQPQGQPQIQQQQQQQQLYQQQIQQPQNPFQQQNVFSQQQQYQQPVAPPPKADKASIMALFNYPQPAPQQPAEAGTSMNGQGDLLGLGGQPAAQGTPQNSVPQRSVSTPLPGNNNPFHNMTSGASAVIPDPSASTSSKSSVPRSEEKIPSMEPIADIGSMPGIGASLNAGVGLMRGVGGSMGHGGGMGVGGMAGVGGPKRQSAMRDSVSLGMDMGWSNGRHSPDAFASLSARAGR